MINYTRLHNKKTIHQHLYNEGRNEDNLQFEKNTLLFDSIRNHFDLIQTEPYYPNEDLQQIDLTLDVVILKYEEFQKLIKNRI